jgi:uncharacterized protein (TIGR02147 family)
MRVFNETKYKEFLLSYIERLPKRGRGQIGRIAKHLRVSSTLISQILSGDRHFSLEQAEGVTEYLGLSQIEADYFILLVHAERAGTAALKKYYVKKLEKVREDALKISTRIEAQRNLSDLERAVFYSSHLFAAAWLFTSVGKDGKTIEEICHRFDLPRPKILEVLKFLSQTGLCIEKDGRFKMGPQSTHVEQGSPYLFHHYRNWRIKAIQQSEFLSDRDLMYTAAVSLSSDDFRKLREEMVQFIKTFLARTHESPAEEIACFNLDFFWISK